MTTETANQVDVGEPQRIRFLRWEATVQQGRITYFFRGMTRHSAARRSSSFASTLILKR